MVDVSDLKNWTSVISGALAIGAIFYSWLIGRSEKNATRVAAVENTAADHAKALVNLARVRLDLERPADAVEPVEHAVELDAESVAARRVLARTYHSQGRREAAEESYLAALALDSDDAWSLNNLGLLRIEEERFEEAIAPLERACAVDAGQARFFNNLGVARERTRRYRAAEQAYTRAMSLDPSSAKAEVSLARIAPLGGPVDEPVGVLAVGPIAGPITEAPVEIPQEDGREH